MISTPIQVCSLLFFSSLLLLFSPLLFASPLLISFFIFLSFFFLSKEDPKYQHDGMASRTFLPYANLIGTEYVLFTSSTTLINRSLPFLMFCLCSSSSFLFLYHRFTAKMVTPLLQYCSDIKEELKPNSPSLVIHSLHFSLLYLSFALFYYPISGSNCYLVGSCCQIYVSNYQLHPAAAFVSMSETLEEEEAKKGGNKRK